MNKSERALARSRRTHLEGAAESRPPGCCRDKVVTVAPAALQGFEASVGRVWVVALDLGVDLAGRTPELDVKHHERIRRIGSELAEWSRNSALLLSFEPRALIFGRHLGWLKGLDCGSLPNIELAVLRSDELRADGGGGGGA